MNTLTETPFSPEPESPARKPFQFPVTCVLIAANLLVWAAMSISGVNWLFPDPQSMVRWGGNFRPETLHHGWWRLFTSVFLHYGIIHLLLNMSALFYIGRILEPLVQSKRFLLVYLVSGIFGSLFSLYWNTAVVSAGASGAIFGMMGLYLFLLLNKSIHEPGNRNELVFMSVFVALNLLAGIRSSTSVLPMTVDHAAHIGGLLAGFLSGKILAASLEEPDHRASWRQALLILVSGTLVVTVTLFLTIKDPLKAYDEKMKHFSLLEKQALEIYAQFRGGGSNKEALLYEINDRGVYFWTEAKTVLQEIESLDLPEELLQRNTELKRYCDIRLKTYNLLHHAVQEESNAYDEQIREYDRQIEAIIAKMQEK